MEPAYIIPTYLRYWRPRHNNNTTHNTTTDQLVKSMSAATSLFSLSNNKRCTTPHHTITTTSSSSTTYPMSSQRKDTGHFLFLRAPRDRNRRGDGRDWGSTGIGEKQFFAPNAAWDAMGFTSYMGGDWGARRGAALQDGVFCFSEEGWMERVIMSIPGHEHGRAWRPVWDLGIWPPPRQGGRGVLLCMYIGYM